MQDSLFLPTPDTAEFAALPKAVREDVSMWLRELRQVFASRHVTKALSDLARRLQVSYQTARRKYYDLKKTGDWRCLINWSKARKRNESVPFEILEEFRARCEGNQRKSKPAWRRMIKVEWKHGTGKTRDGKPLASLPWPESINGGQWPDGCSYDNLMRLCRERFNTFDLTAMRDGLGKAMAQNGHKVRTTRVGLWVGSHYLFDDLTRDTNFLLIPKQQIVRIQELGAFDLYAADRFAIHRRPQFLRADGKKDSLKECEMRFLLANVLRNFGYSPRGTEIPAELGTATIRKPLQEFTPRPLSLPIQPLPTAIRDTPAR